MHPNHDAENEQANPMQGLIDFVKFVLKILEIDPERLNEEDVNHLQINDEQFEDSETLIYLLFVCERLIFNRLNLQERDDEMNLWPDAQMILLTKQRVLSSFVHFFQEWLSQYLNQKAYQN